MTWFLAMVIQSLFIWVVWGLAIVIAAGLLKLIPDGRIKRFLTRTVGHRSADPRYRDE